jgi:hypothetical protein
MTPQRLYQTAIRPALDELVPLGIASSPQAARFILAIALQETGLRNRRQVVAGGAEVGPAASFWQFEQGGGVKGVLTHSSAAKRMAAVCESYNVQPTTAGLWEAMRYQDIVAAAAARLLVYTLPGALPATEAEGWAQYVSAWRPGKPHPETWPAAWKVATETVGC